MGIRKFIFKNRGYTPIPLALIILYFAQPGNSFIVYGSILLIFGEYIRFSGVRYAGGITRTTKVGAPSLCTSGPFSHVRNPLYIGNIIMYTGVVLIAGAPNIMAMLIITWCFFIIQYGLIIALEEETLTELFAAEYKLYKQNVHAFIPRFTPWNPSDSRVPISYKKTFKTEKRTLQNSLFVLVLILVRAQFPAV
jgi:protein-S-isoprenylcysteine O-methyltransferase Ste14